MNPASREELSDLLGALRDGRLTDEQTARLEAIIAADPEARREYIDYVFLCTSLRDHHAPPGSEAPGSEASGSDGAAGRIGLQPAGRRYSHWSIAAAMLISVGVAVALMTRWQSRPLFDGVDGVAVLTKAVDAKWIGGAGPTVGSALPVGTLRLGRGLAQIEFYSGATVILEGPAELDLVSPHRGYFHHGKIRTHVPPQAQGFTIGAPGVNVVDLGTEFGMRLDPSGRAEVHVFDGKVELHPQAEPMREMVTGHAVSIQAGRTNVIDNSSEVFIDPARLDELAGAQVRRLQQRWSIWREQVKGDPAALAYYTFDEPRGWGRSLANEAAGGKVTDGAVVGCQWVGGRWAGRTALDFKRSSDRVRIDVPGEYGSITLAAWVRVDGFDRWLSSLMLTDEWNAQKPGSPHWQLSWDGEMILGVSGGQPNYTSPANVVGPGDLGRWIHLATVYDGPAGTVTHYRDGKAVSVSSVRASHRRKLWLGAAEIGNWARPAPNDKSLRNFNGRIDEFILWSRPLPASEIETMYEAGRPN